MNPREIKTPPPVRVIVTAVGIGVLVLGTVLWAIWYSGTGIQEAKMTGVIVGKEFVAAPEHQINLGRKGELYAGDVAGEYILTVEVPQKDGSKKPYKVWLDKKRYEALKEGDSFDVGPYLVRDGKE